MVTSNYSVPSPVTATPYSKSTYLDDHFTEDVYTFEIDETSSINLSLHDITSGDDADLYLYRDSNSNGLLDATDELIQYPYLGENADEAINVRAEAGTYFARVNLYSGGSDSRLDYELDLSATPEMPYPADDPAQAPNLLPREVDVGSVFGSGPQTFSDWVGDTDTADTYAFSVPSFHPDSVYLMQISLTGLSNDADIRLIEDIDGDRIVDDGEVFGSSTNSGSLSESIDILLEGGDYFVQVYQYDGDTSYQLTFA